VNAIAYGLGQVIGLLGWVVIFYVIILFTLPPHARRRVLRMTGRLLGRLVWAVLCAPALGLLWLIGRFDGVEDRRRDWQRRHAAECRVRARQCRSLATHQLTGAAVVPETVELYAAHADQLDWLADQFADDAADVA